MKNILVIGGGSIGQAIGDSVAPNTIVNIFDNDPTRSTVKTIEEGISTAELIFVCVPSQVLKSVINTIAESKTEAGVVLLTKGLDEETGDFPYELLQKAGIKRWAILYGPMIAQELLAKKHSFGILASLDNTLFEEVKGVFSDFLHIEYSSDIRTTAILGISKNIYSFGAGILQGMNVGQNVLGMYGVRVLQEMKSIVGEFGGDKGQAEYVAGLGDFIATSTSESSKNRTTGDNLVNGSPLPKTSEGLVSLQSFCKKLSVCPPLMKTLSNIVKNQEAPETLLKTLISYE